MIHELYWYLLVAVICGLPPLEYLNGKFKVCLNIIFSSLQMFFYMCFDVTYFGVCLCIHLIRWIAQSCGPIDLMMVCHRWFIHLLFLNWVSIDVFNCLLSAFFLLALHMHYLCSRTNICEVCYFADLYLCQILLLEDDFL